MKHPVPFADGIPTLMAGGRPLPSPVFCLFHDQAFKKEVVATLSKHGIGAFAVRNMIGVGPGKQTQATIALSIRRFATVARAAPQAWILADCLLFPSENWLLANPDEAFITADRQILVTGPNGDSDRRDYLTVPGSDLRDVKTRLLYGEKPRLLYARRRVSPFSQAFAHAAANSVNALVRGCEAAGFAKQLWGIFIGCYVCGEWNLHMMFPDHCRVAVEGFRRFLSAT